MVGTEDPAEQTAHRARALACLDRNDWPELAEEIRAYTPYATPPEILALYSD